MRREIVGQLRRLKWLFAGCEPLIPHEDNGGEEERLVGPVESEERVTAGGLFGGDHLRQRRLQPAAKAPAHRTEEPPAAPARRVELLGYAVVWGERFTHLGRELSFAPNCLDGCLRSGAVIQALLQHIPSRRVGSTADGSLQLMADSYGLLCFLSIDPADQAGAVVVDGVREGELLGMSIGYLGVDRSRRNSPEVSTFSPDGGVTFGARHIITETSICEVSIVTRGGNPAAAVILVDEPPALGSYSRAFETLKGKEWAHYLTRHKLVEHAQRLRRTGTLAAE